MMSTNQLNYAVQNKWIADIPVSMILENTGDISLNLTTFAIPAVDINAVTVNFKGTSIETPGSVVQASSKELTFNYIIDSNWANYKVLYKYVDQLARFTKIVKSEEYSTRGLGNTLYKKFSIPITVYLLNEFKDRVMEFKYYNCWIKSFAELSMSYTDVPSEVTHSFTIAYSDFELKAIN